MITTIKIDTIKLFRIKENQIKNRTLYLECGFIEINDNLSKIKCWMNYIFHKKINANHIDFNKKLFVN